MLKLWAIGKVKISLIFFLACICMNEVKLTDSMLRKEVRNGLSNGGNMCCKIFYFHENLICWAILKWNYKYVCSINIHKAIMFSLRYDYHTHYTGCVWKKLKNAPFFFTKETRQMLWINSLKLFWSGSI